MGVRAMEAAQIF